MSNGASRSYNKPTDKTRPYRTLVTAVLVVPLLLFGIVMWHDYRVVVRETRQEVQRTTEIFRQHALNVFETHQLITERINERLRGMSWNEIGRSKAIQTYLMKICSQYPQVDAIWLADPSGAVRNASQPLPATAISVADRDYFQSLRKADLGMFIGHIVSGKILKKLNFNLAHRRESTAGSFDGVIIITVFPEYFSNFWSNTTKNSDITSALIRSDGKILARAPRINPQVLTMPQNGQFMHEIRKAEQGTYFGVSANDGLKRFFAFHKVGGYNVYLVHAIGMRVVLQEWRKDLALYGIFFLGATGALLQLALLALRRAREEQEAVQHYQLLFETMHQGVVYQDADGQITTANPAALRILGKPLEALQGRTSAELEHHTLHADGSEFPSHDHPSMKAMKTGESLSGVTMAVYRPQEKDYRWITITAVPLFRDGEEHPYQVYTIFDDITERKRAEDELNRAYSEMEAKVRERTVELQNVNETLTAEISERKRAEDEILHLKDYLANIIDSMPSMLVGMDRNQTIIQWNRQAEVSTGVPAAKAIGRQLDVLMPEFSPWVKAMRNEVQQLNPASMEKLLIEKDGERHFYDLMLYPLISNCFEGTVIRIEDVTERTRIQEMMVQTEKMVSVGGLAAGMAHEINNPLGIITQAAQNIERRVSPDLPANQQAAEEAGIHMNGLTAYFEHRQIPAFIASIRDAATRASRIVANMLRFSRQAEATMLPAPLADVLEQALELAANDYDLKKKYDFRSIEIIRDYAPDLPRVPMVMVEIEQVLLNLLKNAAQAMTENPPERKPRIMVRISIEEKYAVIEVDDNGPGMAEDTRRRVFEPFFTTKEPGIGTGLGLSVSYMIVTRNHKGLMEVASTPGNGARFTVRLPLSNETPQT